ncbi:MAG: hypothetical protein IJX17_05660 [Clostridia bacterium]|nr:hypothetical protein [Clostridia bacterium]
MGFYKSKLNSYSKSMSFSQKQLDETRKRIIEQKHMEIEELRKSLQLSRRAGLDGYDNSEYDDERNAYQVATQEIGFISVMDTPSFYSYMASVENYTLSQIEDKAFTDMANNIKTMGKYKSQKGLVGKASALFGVDKKMIAKTSKMLDDNNLTADVSQEARKEWQSMTPEEQAVYIAARFEIDKKTSFDRRGFENYKTLYAQKKAEKSDEIEMGR